MLLLTIFGVFPEFLPHAQENTCLRGWRSLSNVSVRRLAEKECSSARLEDHSLRVYVSK
jgi:hypothetical protein